MPNTHPTWQSPSARFDGAEIIDAVDAPRLTGQIKRVHDLMIDGRWRTLREIEDSTGDPASSISAQLRNLRKRRFGSFVVERMARGDRGAGLFEYRLAAQPEPAPEPKTQADLFRAEASER